MLIAISGPSSSGKGTILYDLESRGYSVLHRQYARELLAELNLTVNDIKSLSVTDKLNFHQLLLTRKRTVELPFIDTKELVFTERTFIDFYVYYYLYQQFPSITFLAECLKYTYNYYHQIFFLTECPVIENDGIRITDLEIINKQKDLFMSIYSSIGLSSKVCLISETNRIDRISIISNRIGNISYG